ncbi:MAG: PilN domain-containing protein [Fibrobacter sp.]|nr:PilN domain-containing protein [Fibrobacter sp.]
MNLIEINLLPPEYRTSKRDLTWLTDRRVIWPTIAVLVFVFIGFVAWLNMNDKLDDLNSDLRRVNASIEANRPTLEKIKQLDERLELIAQKNKALMSIQVSKKRWVILFESISSVLPANMWLTALVEVEKDLLEIKGSTYDFSEIAEYMVSLERQISFSSMSLVSIEKQMVKAEQVYSFTIQCMVNPELGLEEVADE